jgi:phosphatidylserine/phosphatidylglycerophosphate/cardiolipin synthase-like enzyme
MADFLTTSAASHHIERIILTAKSQIFLFSPYLKLSQILFERLRDATRRNIKVIIVYGKDELKPSERQKLFSLDNVTIYFLENLHAKCYFNESNMVITSMNIHEFSEKNNREMGILLSRQHDLNVFKQAYDEAVSIVKNATKIKATEHEIMDGAGYCIRCAHIIKFNQQKPLCLTCYRQWSKFNNKLYPEKYCHCCGSQLRSSFSEPLCTECVTNAVKS